MTDKDISYSGVFFVMFVFIGLIFLLIILFNIDYSSFNPIVDHNFSMCVDALAGGNYSNMNRINMTHFCY